MKLIKTAYIKQFGLQKCEKKAEEFAQDCLRNFSVKCQASTRLPVKQKGGVVLPSNYFGVEGSGYVDSDMGTSMQPTAELLRPSIPQTFKSPLIGGGCGSCSAMGGMIGGAIVQFKISEAAINEVMSGKGHNKQKIMMHKERFEGLFGKAIHKACKTEMKKGGKVLTYDTLKSIITSEKQYKTMC